MMFPQIQVLLYLFCFFCVFNSITGDSTVGQSDFPNEKYFWDEAHFFDKDGVYRGGVPQFEDFKAEEALLCTEVQEMVNSSVPTSHGYCSKWDTEAIWNDGTTKLGNCSCVVEASTQEYCDAWYCQKTTVEPSGKEIYDWQRCICSKEYQVLDTDYGLSCDAWVCDEGQSADNTYSELWQGAEATDESEWECTVRRWRSDITGVFCDHWDGDEVHTQNYFSMTGCSCIKEEEEQDYCLEYKCQTYSMHKCNVNYMGCGVLAAAIPIAGFFGGICFVCLVYAMCFSGPKNTVWDNMGCFDFEWYDGLGCWFNFVHGALSGAFCCHILIWVMPCWKGGCGMVGATLIAFGAFCWAGVYGLVGCLAVYLALFGCFKFMTPKLYPHCRCRLNHHSHSSAGWHVNFHTGGYIEIPHKHHMNWERHSCRTLEFWIRPIAHHQSTLFEKPSYITETGHQNINFRLDMTHKGFLHVYDKRRAHMAGARAAVISDQVLDKNRWSHVALVFNSQKKEISFYFNGELDSTHHWIPGPENDQPLLVCHGDTLGWYHGRLAEVRLWKTARDKNELQANMNKRIRGINEDLVAYFRLNEEDGNMAQDRALNPTQGILNGKCKFVAMHAPDIEEEPHFPFIELREGPVPGKTWITEHNMRSLAFSRDFTLECWVRANDSPSFNEETQVIMDKGSRSYGLGRMGKKVCLWMADARYETGIELQPNQWVHIGVSVDDDLEHKAFVNGEVVGHTFGVKNCKLFKDNPLTIGFRQVKDKQTQELLNEDIWEGDIVEARIWGFARGVWNMVRCYKLFFVNDLEEGLDAEVQFGDGDDAPVLKKRHLETSDIDLVGCFHLYDYDAATPITRPVNKEPSLLEPEATKEEEGLNV
mmetsp:Transcript_30337/g.40019  ORF Transcript_30337/g.40019 Transcript_30337/m.40019 type:complete len:872 (+) Transcript_30337:206-2821(+)|eukprot:CAMPEP_0117758104 /NCGR_PEP_ID=MMETSP0947-20121206/15168_1 /TAXON_ID=44440 /ORGANISM="Chattonella subsalsa, Strain CCMP2191" /LENGTH=871 /DNA_ID=CAMNT_0005578205 /DNA_START=109 /DNA_END=2724 /DNA_ORIENTATION=+